MNTITTPAPRETCGRGRGHEAVNDVRRPHPSPDARPGFVRSVTYACEYSYSEVRLCYLEMGVTVHIQVVAVVAGGARCGWEPRPPVTITLRA